MARNNLASSSYKSADSKKNSRRGSATLITGTPYKNALKASLAEKNRRESAKKSAPKFRKDFVTKQKEKMKKSLLKIKAPLRKRVNTKLTKNLTTYLNMKNYLVLDDDSHMDCVGDEDAECVFCCGLFSEDNSGEKWIKCA